MTRKYRNGAQQQETLRALLDKFEDHQSAEVLEPLITTALSAEVPAQALSDVVGISYSGLLNWINDGESTTARAGFVPRIQTITTAMSIGVKLGVLPTSGEQLGAVLSLLARCVDLKQERDAAQQQVVQMRTAMAAVGKAKLPQEVVNTYNTDEA